MNLDTRSALSYRPDAARLAGRGGARQLQEGRGEQGQAGGGGGAEGGASAAQRRAALPLRESFTHQTPTALLCLAPSWYVSVMSLS